MAMTIVPLSRKLAIGVTCMYSTGDSIIHPRYGAGVVQGKRELTFLGETRDYHVLELIGDRGEVMIPVTEAEDMDIRPAIQNMDTIEDVFANTPEVLSDNYRTRQAGIDQKIKTRDPKNLAQALRDLAWREHVHKLTGVEKNMKAKLVRMLSREMAVVRPNVTIANASSRLQEMLVEMIQMHQPTTQPATVA